MNVRQKKKQFKKKYGKWSKNAILRDCFVMVDAWNNFWKSISECDSTVGRSLKGR